MKYMKPLVCKLQISYKRLKKQLWAIITDAFAAIGVLVTIAEAANEVFNYQGIFEFYRMHVWWITPVIMIVCVFKNWDHLNYTVRIADLPDVTITLKVCDVLKNEGAVIIPTNSTFDTVMDDEFISEGSIQGQYQIRFFKNRFYELDKKLEDGLVGKTYVELKDDRKHNKKRYPIGTVSRINEKNKRAYFLADSDIDPKGHPIDVDASDVSQALSSLWNELHREGNSEAYSIPLIGTGKARAKDVSRDEVIQQIILSFLAASKDHKITEKLIICIFPGDFEKIDWDSLCEFLKYQSQYANVKPVETKPIGTAENSPKVITYNGEYEIEDSDDISDQPKLPPAQGQLTEKEQMMVTLLTGNKMSRSQISEAMGLSMAQTNHLLRGLLDSEIVICEGSKSKKRFFVPNPKRQLTSDSDHQYF